VVSYIKKYLGKIYKKQMKFLVKIVFVTLVSVFLLISCIFLIYKILRHYLLQKQKKLNKQEEESSSSTLSGLGLGSDYSSSPADPDWLQKL
jgi:p-aminobenzoyl-glutamate transporter AbgT